MRTEQTLSAWNPSFTRDAQISFLALAPVSFTGSQLTWREPPATPSLCNDELHVWCAWLDRLGMPVEQCLEMLSLDERARAARFYFERDSTRFVIGRGLLRTILGRYLDVGPARLVFSYSSRGKPRLLSSEGRDLLYFNVAHSDGIALYAVTRRCEVGIDVEHVRAISEADQIAARFFSERESVQWKNVPASHRLEFFFKCWTRKEACVKASGDGVSETLSRLDVSMNSAWPAGIVGSARSGGPSHSWLLYELSPALGYTAALAITLDPHCQEHFSAGGSRT